MNIGTPITQLDFTDPNGVFKDETFLTVDIQVITLKQHLKDQAMDRAWDVVEDLNDLEATIDKLLITQYSSAKEFVSVEEDRIVVAVNKNDIDFDSVMYAFHLLSKIEGGFTERRLIEFGEDVEVYAQVKNN